MKIEEFAKRVAAIQELGATTIFHSTEEGLFTDLGPFITWDELRDAQPVLEVKLDPTWHPINIAAFQPMPGQTVEVLCSDGTSKLAAWYRTNEGPTWMTESGATITPIKYRNHVA